MEMEYSQIMSRDKLEFLDILKEALKIATQNLGFTIFASLTSFPFFCFLVFYELVLQQTLQETFKYFSHGSYRYWAGDFWVTESSTKSPSLPFVKLFLLYLVPYHLPELLSTTTVVDLASKIHGGETPTNLREVVQKSIKKITHKGLLITSTYVLLLCTSSLLGLSWIVANYYILSRGFNRYYYSYYNDEYYYNYRSLSENLLGFINFALHGAAFLGLLVKCMEWNGAWNMSLVISILEAETYGSEAFEASAYFSRGSSRWRGAPLMLVFFLWGCFLRLPCVLLGGCYKGFGGILFTLVYASLICIGNVMKWVVCVVYYFDCRRRVLEKKVDEEIGTQVKSVNA